MQNVYCDNMHTIMIDTEDSVWVSGAFSGRLNCAANIPHKISLPFRVGRAAKRVKSARFLWNSCRLKISL